MKVDSTLSGIKTEDSIWGETVELLSGSGWVDQVFGGIFDADLLLYDLAATTDLDVTESGTLVAKWPNSDSGNERLSIFVKVAFSDSAFDISCELGFGGTGGF